MSTDILKQTFLETKPFEIQGFKTGIRYCVFETRRQGKMSMIRKDNVETQYAHLVVTNPDKNSPVQAVWVKGCNNKSEGLGIEIHTLGVSDEALNVFYSEKERPYSTDFFCRVSEETKAEWFKATGSSLAFSNRKKLVTQAVQTLAPDIRTEALTERIIIKESDSLDYMREAGGREAELLSIPKRVMQSLKQVEYNHLFSDDQRTNSAMVEVIRDVLTKQFEPKIGQTNTLSAGEPERLKQ